MKVVHVPCGPAVNESERKALERIKARLRSEPGGDEWLLLTNLAFSATPLRQSEEIDIVAIGPPGVQIVEVKHWTETWVKRNFAIVEREAERVSEKARKIGTMLRKRVPNLPRVEGVFLVTQPASKNPTIKDIRPVRGVPFYTLKTRADAVGLFAQKVLSRDEVRKLGAALEPWSTVALDGTLKRMANYSRLTLLTPRDQRFHRVYDATHTSRQDRVKLHLYDLSADDDAKALQKAEREWKSLNRLQQYDWAPRIVDSFQDAPGYPGEIKFFTIADPMAPSIEKRADDDSWDARARLIFARRSVRALRELHEAHSDGEESMVHRNLTPRTILVKHDNSPIFTGFEQARIPKDETVATPVAEQEWEDEVAPEVRKQGIHAADQRSDVFSLCASLSVLFTGAEEESVAEISKILISGMKDNPKKRIGLPELDKRLSKRLGEAIPAPPPPSARFWTEDQIVPFSGNNYRIVSSLGSGGVGTAFKVVKLDRDTQEELGTYVAKVARDEDLGRSVLRSYALVAHAHLHHSALSTIFEVAREWRKNSFVALMSWVEGEPLEEQIGYIPLLADDLQEESGEGLALKWLRNACDGLSGLHGSGLIHGDISPRNMIVSGAELVLTDYDCVTRIGSPAASPGTALYSSPSRLQGLEASPSDDLYALAASFFHVLFEKEPFNYGGNQEKERGLNWDGASRDDYPLVSEFLDRATNPESTKRLASVAEARLVLQLPQYTASSAENSTPEASGGIADGKETLRMGSMTKFQPTERKQNEVKWLESLLQSYPGSRWGNSETRGLDSEFAAATYVETNLERALYRDIVERRISLVILCGNAGDGKTALLQHLAQRLGLEQQTSATRILKGQLDDGLTVRMNLDGSASWQGNSADELLDEFFKPFHNGRPVEDIVHLLAINDGRLLEWIEGGEESLLRDDLWDLLAEKPPPSDSHIRFVNLNHRSLVGGIVQGEAAITSDFLDQLLDELYGGSRAAELWSPCSTCLAQERCEVFRANQIFGPEELADHEMRHRARERLFELLQAVHLRGETHITVRELRAALVFVLFGIHNCREIHAATDHADTPEPYWDRAFSPDALGRQGEVLRELPLFDPGIEAHPQIDRRLLHPPIDADASDGAAPNGLDLKSARRRAYFEWARGEIKNLTGDLNALGLAGGRNLHRFRDIAIVDDVQRTELVRELCGGISRLEALPPLALERAGKVPLRVSSRTPTETAYWVEKSLCDFRLEADLPSGELRDGGGQDLLQRQASLIYSYRDGREERLRLGADLFRLLLELNDGYQLGDIASDDTFAHLSIFVQRLVQEDHRQMLAWNPMREDRIFEIVAKSEGADSEPRKILTIAPIENPGSMNGE